MSPCLVALLQVLLASRCFSSKEPSAALSSTTSSIDANSPGTRGNETASQLATMALGEVSGVLPLPPDTDGSSQAEHEKTRNESIYQLTDKLESMKPLDPNTSPDQTAAKIKVLAEATKQVSDLAMKTPGNSTLSELSAIFDRILKLPPSEALAGDPEREIVSRIIRYAAEVIGNVSRTTIDMKPLSLSETVMKIVKKLSPTDSVEKKFKRENFRGNSIYSVPGLDVSIMCVVNAWTHAGFVIYPKDTSLRPLPDTEFPITRFQVVDLILIPVEGGRQSQNQVRACSDYEYFDMLVLRWIPRKQIANLKHGCAQWSESNSTWTSENCIVVETLELPRNVSCFCDTTHSGHTSEYIVYEFQEDIEAMTYIDDGLEMVNDTSDVTEMIKYESLIADIAVSINTSDIFEKFLSRYLLNLMLFKSDILINNSTGFILEDIGKILAIADPEPQKSIVGRRNKALSGCIVRLDTYRRSPPIGFGFYRNYTNGIEYFRSTEDLDLNYLFGNDSMQYSLLFSMSVIQQNTRYAFLLYPPDTYFKPTIKIAGINVGETRVLDIVFSPDVADKHDQLLHMFSGRDKIKNTGCGYWSENIGNWTTKDCFVNAGLYKGVCTCNMTANFNQSRTRGQYVIFQYQIADFGRKFEYSDYMDAEYISASIFGLKELEYYPRGQRTVRKEMTLLNSVLFRTDATYKLKGSVKAQLMQEVRYTLINNFCTPIPIMGYLSIIGAVCSSSSGNQSDYKLMAFATQRFTSGLVIRTYNTANYTLSGVFSNETLLAVRISPSVTQQNEKYAFLIYAHNAFFEAQPSFGYRVITSQVVDVILLPNAESKSDDQFVEIFIDQSKYNSTLGCAFWSVGLQSWTARGCNTVQVESLTVCRCSLSRNVYQSALGGQYIAYTYTEAYFDQQVYALLGSETISDDRLVFAQGAALIHNASQIPLDDEVIVQMMRVFLKILPIKEDARMQDTLRDIERAISRFCIDPTKLLISTKGIEGSWGTKNTVLTKDLFSNAVLTANDTSAVASTSYMAFVSLGYVFCDVDPIVCVCGMQFARNSSHLVEYISNSSVGSVPETVPLFACFLIDVNQVIYNRFIFVVYPVNMLSYPPSMSVTAIFNYRQVDIYVDVDNDVLKMSFNDKPSTPTLVNVYFQPSDYPEPYVKIGCASWSDKEARWTGDVCSMNESTPFPFCRCDISDRGVTRIVVYEYTTVSNFSLLIDYHGPGIVYLIVASASLVGFILIFMTAILFPKWRAELSNKMLMHLAASSFLYLTLTMLRETHVIYAEANYLSIPLIVFTVTVHYSRLTHYAWGLVMSVLQYRRFSAIVGASTVPHLLLKVCVLAWGVPLLPLVMLLTWKPKEHFCIPDKLTHYVLYLVPGVVITAINIGIMVAIVRVITNCFDFSADEELQRHNVDGNEVMKRQIKHAVLMFFLFGVPAVFEMFNDIGSRNVGLDYITRILDPIQGLVLFLFFVVFNDKARGYWNAQLFGEVVAVGKRPTVNIPLKSMKKRVPTTKFKLKATKTGVRRKVTTHRQAEGNAGNGEGSDHEGEATIHEGEASVHEGESSAHQTAVSDHEGEATIHEGEASVHEGESSAHQTAVSDHEGEATLHEGEASVHEDEASAHQSVVSVHESEASVY